jgi:predicted DCC family thiol-disulfide oxidoreductase YuxK
MRLANDWTGGQYSAVRALVGVALAAHFAARAAQEGPPWIAAGAFAAAGALATAFAVGFRDRAAALALTLSWIALAAWRSDALAPTGVALLGVHVFLPRAPYGAWDARGRPDPSGVWRFPAGIFGFVWLLLGAIYAVRGAVAIRAAPTDAGALALLAFAPLALFARTRPLAWLAAAGAVAARNPGALLLHALAFDPGWIPPRRDGRALLFYDGACGLCHRAVRFLLAEDPRGDAFRFAPLASAAFEAAIPESERARLPDSLVLLLPDGRVLVRARAVIEIGQRLGGIWRAAALLVSVLPKRPLDRAYDVVARVRGRLFTPPLAACPRVPTYLRERFAD